MNGARKELLAAAGIRFVRILWCDNANVIRAKAVHLDLLERLSDGVGITPAQQALPVMADAVVTESGLGPVGEIRLIPDWTTLVLLPYAPGFAQVMGDMTRRNDPWEHCPREFLRQQLAHLSDLGLELRAAFENEFFLLREGADGLEAVDDTVFAATEAMNASGEVILAITEALETQGLEVAIYHPESGPGQQELSIAYAEALQAADQQITFRETVRGVARRRGLTASFLPKIFGDKAGSGCHLNLSLWRQGRNITGDPSHPSGLGREARAFMAGILLHLPGLSAITIPSSNSFRRIRPHYWAGAFTVWGTDNREAAVRVPSSPNGREASRFELKTSDASANPYLALGAVIASGVDGLARELALPEEVTTDPGLIPEGQRSSLGIRPLPQSLGEALEALRSDSTLLDALGAERARAYLAVREAEWRALEGLSLEEEVALLRSRY